MNGVRDRLTCEWILATRSVLGIFKDWHHAIVSKRRAIFVAKHRDRVRMNDLVSTYGVQPDSHEVVMYRDLPTVSAAMPCACVSRELRTLPT